MIYLSLFWSMFQIGLFSIGGGYAAIPLIQHQIVESRGWLSAAEFADVVSIAEMTPGPIAINSATFVGIRVAGLPGAVVATLGCVLPSCVITILLAKIYYKYAKLDAIQYVLSGLRPAVVAMIASAGLGIILMSFFVNGAISFEAGNVSVQSIAMFAIGLYALRKWKPSPILIMLASGLAGILLYALSL